MLTSNEFLNLETALYRFHVLLLIVFSVIVENTEL
jgi:hypothetical protein